MIRMDGWAEERKEEWGRGGRKEGNGMGGEES